MVQIRKPVQRSEDILDYRVKRSPRGVIPSSAAAVAAKQRADREAEMRRLIEENRRRYAALQRIRARRG